MSEPGTHCSHGKSWHEECPECALVSAEETVRHWGRAVDEARRVIAEAEKRQEVENG
jgi:hypothetical protein